MNTDILVKQLYEGTAASRGRTPLPCIVRIASADAYRRLLDRIRTLIPQMPKLADLRPLPAIRGIAVSLDSPRRIARHPAVDFVERDRKVRCGRATVGKVVLPASRPIPAWAYGLVLPWGVRQIRADQAWKHTMGEKVKIAVIDTGIDYTHRDLREAVAGGVNLLEAGTPPMDDNGHGTHIAGTIAAAARHAGVVGVAPLASLYAVKAFDSRGAANLSDIINGIYWCIANKMDVINMSFGMKRKSRALHAAVKAACRAGIAVVASSGNEGKAGVIDYPARFRETIAVGATARNQTIAPFSNRSERIDLYAPGESILSAWPGNAYRELSGTSMATSHISGVAALLLAARPQLSPQRLKAVLRTSAANRRKKGRAGKAAKPGEANALAAVRAVLARRRRKR